VYIYVFVCAPYTGCATVDLIRNMPANEESELVLKLLNPPIDRKLKDSTLTIRLSKIPRSGKIFENTSRNTHAHKYYIDWGRLRPTRAGPHLYGQSGVPGTAPCLLFLSFRWRWSACVSAGAVVLRSPEISSVLVSGLRLLRWLCWCESQSR